MTPATCSSCGAAIEWTITEKGKRMPVDAVPTPDGNLTLSMRGGPGVAIYLKPEQKAELVAQAKYRGVSALFFVSHFATCKFAAQHRRPA